MDNIQNRKIKAYAAIEHVMDKYPTIVAGATVLQTAVADYKLKLRVIELFNVPDIGGTVPGTNFKLTLMEEVEVNAEVERTAVLLYARENNLPVLEGKMPRLSSMLQEGTGEERLRRCQNIHDEANALGVALVPFGCDAALLTEQTAKLPLLRTALSSTQDAIDDRVESQKQFRKRFRDMDKFIKDRLDLAVKTRTKEFPDFVEEYLLAKIMPTQPAPNNQDGGPKPKLAKKEVATSKVATMPPMVEEEAVVGFRDVPAPPPSEDLQHALDGIVPLENGAPATNGQA